MKQSKATIREWIPILDACIENWKMTVKDGASRWCPACAMMDKARGERIWQRDTIGNCRCPLSTPDAGCCDGRYDEWANTGGADDARRVLAYIRKVRKQLAEALK